MARIKLEAVKPAYLPSSKEYVEVMQRAAHKSANASLRDLKATTRTWQHRVDFGVSVQETDQLYSVTAGTDDTIYGYVDDGTRPHIIRPRRSRYLSFRVGGRSKTRPNVINSSSGSQGQDWRRAYFVLHPGSGARNFTRIIAKRRQKSFDQDVAQGIAKIARKAR